jgi:hypothetical protein
MALNVLQSRDGERGHRRDMFLGKDRQGPGWLWRGQDLSTAGRHLAPMADQTTNIQCCGVLARTQEGQVGRPKSVDPHLARPPVYSGGNSGALNGKTILQAAKNECLTAMFLEITNTRCTSSFTAFRPSAMQPFAQLAALVAAIVARAVAWIWRSTPGIDRGTW